MEILSAIHGCFVYSKYILNKYFFEMLDTLDHFYMVEFKSQYFWILLLSHSQYFYLKHL